MPNILGNDIVTIQPNTSQLPLSITLDICTSATANDGQIPYGDSLSSAVVKAYDLSGADVTSSMVGDVTVSGQTITVLLSYFSGALNGRYKLTFIYTCGSGYVDEIDAKRIVVRDT